jgi:hypothetical protein
MVCDKHGILKVWLKTVHIGKADGSSLDHWEVNCKTSQWRLTSFVNYDKDGRVTNSDEHVVVEWQDAIPDSVGEKELNTVCRKKP